MSQSKTILVAVDVHADCSAAIERGRRLARSIDGRLLLFSCTYNQYVSREYFQDHDALAHARRSLVRSHREMLEALAEPIRADGDDVDVEAAWDQPVDEGIIRKAMAVDAAVVVSPVREHVVHKLPFFTSVDWQLIRHCPCPLMLVKRRQPWPESPRVVAAVDPLHRHGKPEDLDHVIVDESERLADLLDGNLYVFHAYEPLAPHGTDVELLPVDDVEASLEGRHNRALMALVANLQLPADHVRLAEGRAEERLPDFVKEKSADIVVLGAVARDAMKRIFVGSTAEKVLDHLDCDLLVVKASDFVTPVRAERYPHDAGASFPGVPGI